MAETFNDPRFAEISRERVSDRIAGELMKMISGGELPPGERLPGERQLAEMMSVSRVSVRAALQQLKARGMIESVQGGGTRVVSSMKELDSPLTALVRVDPENLRDLIELRGNLEVWAARRAAKRADAQAISHIGQIVRKMTEGQPRRDYQADDDLAFHLAVARAAGSPVYMHIIDVIRDVLSAMMKVNRYRIFKPGDADVALGHHKAIYEAIESGDEAAAGRAMQVHLDWVLDRYQPDMTFDETPPDDLD
ncbi:MAG: FadR family transcriptional regulator [Alphaproteobacteria bacterium]|nr:FadR family transcriptional regulator [Alphaproteobacteria bacterium]